MNGETETYFVQALEELLIAPEDREKCVRYAGLLSILPRNAHHDHSALLCETSGYMPTDNDSIDHE